MKRSAFLCSIFGGFVQGSRLVNRKRQLSAVNGELASGRAEQLAARLIEDSNATYFLAAAYLGDRLGLFKAMAGAGPLTGDQLAAKVSLNRRYVLEWLRAVAAAHYIDYRAESNTFELPTEHIAVLVDEDSPVFAAGLIEATVPDILMLHRVQAAFGTGKGISYGDYPPETFDGIERLSKPDYRHRLTQAWLPSVPGIVERLSAGGAAADLGSGAGHASLAIARAFPKAKAFGFEPYAPSVEARERMHALRV